jgi:hypothetical protein
MPIMSLTAAAGTAGHPAGSPPDAVEPVSRDGLMVSEAEYWRDWYDVADRHYEWNNGRLEEKPVSDYETWLVYHWFLALLDRFLAVHPIARSIGLEMGFRLALPSGTVIRKPDFGVVRNDNPRPLGLHDASYRGVYDLCVEALSDLEKRGIERDTVVKKAEYAAGGVPEYYILHHDPAYQAFYGLSEAGIYAPIEPEDGVIRSRVLPGFRFRLSDLCERRGIEVLRDDPLYADFVLPGWREDRERAEAEAAARAEAEARARALEQRLADLEARLRDRDGDG